MKRETPESELLQLCKEQTEIRQAEIFGGLSAAERTTYDAKGERIHALEAEIQASAAGNREKDATDPSTDSSRRRGKGNNEPDKTLRDQE